MIWWLSFADGNRPKGTQFLGVCIVDTGLRDVAKDVDMVEAVRKTHALGINPGGEVHGAPVPAEKEQLVTEKWMNRLLSREECSAIGAEIASASAERS